MKRRNFCKIVPTLLVGAVVVPSVLVETPIDRVNALCARAGAALVRPLQVDTKRWCGVAHPDNYKEIE